MYDDVKHRATAGLEMIFGAGFNVFSPLTCGNIKSTINSRLENSNSFLLQYYETTYTKLYRDAVKLARGLPS